MCSDLKTLDEDTAAVYDGLFESLHEEVREAHVAAGIWNDASPGSEEEPTLRLEVRRVYSWLWLPLQRSELLSCLVTFLLCKRVKISVGCLGVVVWDLLGKGT